MTVARKSVPEAGAGSEGAVARKSVPEAGAGSEGAKGSSPTQAVRLKKHFFDTLLPELMKRLGYRNVLQVPRLAKIVVNVGLGEAVENVHPIRDVHVTLLHLLGLDDNKLTYYHAGRFKQLSQFGGQVITDLLA